MRLLTDQPTLVEQVFEAIVAEVVEGRLKSQDRLIQEDIASQLGVSRQPVQQALLLLRAEGFVQEAPGRGLIVAPIDLKFVQDVYEVRSVTEGLACRLAAERGAEQARREGPALMKAGRFAEAEGSIPMLIDADMRFHKFLYEISGNRVIKETTAPHWRHLQRIMAEVLMRDESPQQIWDQHEQIMEAIARGDPKAAERAAKQHIMKAADRYMARLRSMEQADVPASDIAVKKGKTRRQQS